MRRAGPPATPPEDRRRRRESVPVCEPSRSGTQHWLSAGLECRLSALDKIVNQTPHPALYPVKSTWLKHPGHRSFHGRRNQEGGRAMNTHSQRCNGVWTVILAGILWGAMGMKPVPTYAQKPPAPVSAVSPVNQDIATIDAQRGALDRFLDSHPEIKNDVDGRPDGDERSKLPEGASGPSSFPRQPPADPSRPARVPESGNVADTNRADRISIW